MIEGDATLGGHLLQADDYCRAIAGTVDDVTSTETAGCRFLLVSAGIELLV